MFFLEVYDLYFACCPLPFARIIKSYFSFTHFLFTASGSSLFDCPLSLLAASTFCIKRKFSPVSSCILLDSLGLYWGLLRSSIEHYAFHSDFYILFWVCYLIKDFCVNRKKNSPRLLPHKFMPFIIDLEHF